LLDATGRRFFESPPLETNFSNESVCRRKIDLWDELETEWMILDCELMPWSVKAGEIVRQQYAAVGAASRSALADAVELIGKMAARSADAEPLLARFEISAPDGRKIRRGLPPLLLAGRFDRDLRLAPFHLLATEGQTYFDRNHLWHLETLKNFARPTTRCCSRLIIKS
jgi:protein phosphatase